MLTSQANFLLSLGWAVINSLWQLALLWLIYQLISRIHTKSSAAFRSGLATVLLTAGFGWFILTFLAAFTGANGNEALSATASLINTETANPVLLKLVLPASILYLSLLIIPVSRFIKNYRYVQVIRRYGLEKADAEWRLFVKNISAHMNIGRKVQVWVSEFISSPVTVGWLKPVILLPAAMMTQLSTQQVEALLLHELAHIRRYDYLVNLFINFIRTILYFNPFATAFVKIVEREREKSCDEMVLQFQYCPHEYATALLRLQQASSQPRTFVVAATGKDELLQRVELIMGMQRKKVMPAGRIAGIFAFVITGALLFGSMAAKSGKEPVKDTNYVAYKVAIQDEELPRSYVNHNLTENPALNFAKDERLKTKERKSESTIAAVDEFLEEIPMVAASADELHSGLIQAGLELTQVAPELKKYQEEQVMKALEASKKILTNAQWKAAEKELADLFSQQEKKEIRKKYQQQVEKFDWKVWENKLRSAYNKVDWETVNTQLNNAVNMVRLDSLQQVYSDAVASLDMARKELLLDSVASIPDSEISLKALDKKIKAALSTISDIKATKKKRIVRL